MSTRKLKNYQEITGRAIEPVRRSWQPRNYTWQAPIHPIGPMRKPVSGFKLILWTQQHGRCFYCRGSLLPIYHVDHIHPKSKGGKNHPDNYALACRRCNHGKRDRSAIDYLTYLLRKKRMR